jgi:hypothetical protein
MVLGSAVAGVAAIGLGATAFVNADGRPMFVLNSRF